MTNTIFLFFPIGSASTPGLKKTQPPSMDQLTAYFYGLTISSPKFILKHNPRGGGTGRLSLPERAVNSNNPISLEAEAGDVSSL